MLIIKMDLRINLLFVCLSTKMKLNLKAEFKLLKLVKRIIENPKWFRRSYYDYSICIISKFWFSFSSKMKVPDSREAIMLLPNFL